MVLTTKCGLSFIENDPSGQWCGRYGICGNNDGSTNVTIMGIQ